MTVRVELFGHEAALAGARETTLTLSGGARVSDLLRALGERHPALEGRLSRCRIARNDEFASADEPVGAGDTLALIGPVSGG